MLQLAAGFALICGPTWGTCGQTMPGFTTGQPSARTACAGETGPTVLIIERNPDTLFVAPNDMATPGAAVRRRHQHEGVGKPQRAIYLQGGSGRRNVANKAIDFAAAERDGSGLQHPLTRRNSIVLHGSTGLNPHAYDSLTSRWFPKKRPPSQNQRDAP